MTDLNPTAADCRRAAALISHHGQSNLVGVNAVLQEAVEADRITPLILGMLDLYQTIVPVIYTRLGMQALSAAVIDLARAEVSE